MIVDMEPKLGSLRNRMVGVSQNDRRCRRWSWLCGVVGGIIGLAVAEAGALLVRPRGSPVAAVGQLVIGSGPGWLINFGKEQLGFADKPVLLGVIALLALCLAALAGRSEYARHNTGIIPVGLIAILGILAVAAAPGVGWIAFGPVIAGAGVGYLTLRGLVVLLRSWAHNSAAAARGGDADAGVGRPTTDGAGSNPEQRPMGRRRFLMTLSAVGAVGVAGSTGAWIRSGTRLAATQARDKIKLPRPSRPARPIPRGADLDINGLTPYQTKNSDFYRVDTALRPPTVDPRDWSLHVTGMVANEVRLTFDELLALPLVEHEITMTCVSNQVGGDLVGNARWLGYPLHRLLKKADPSASADMVLSRSVDGFTAGTPLKTLTDPHRGALVAVGMNGHPLPAKHGFPARLVVPGLYGYVSATKWVTELKVTTFADDHGYWTPRGWSARGPIKMSSRIDTPQSSAKAGKVTVAGVAWAQPTGISAVEVQVDNVGPWHRARLAATVGPNTWRQWVWVWDAKPGRHQLTVRAIDANGHRQTSKRAAPAPDGSSGLDTATISVQ